MHPHRSSTELAPRPLGPRRGAESRPAEQSLRTPRRSARDSEQRHAGAASTPGSTLRSVITPANGALRVADKAMRTIPRFPGSSDSAVDLLPPRLGHFDVCLGSAMPHPRFVQLLLRDAPLAEQILHPPQRQRRQIQLACAPQGPVRLPGSRFRLADPGSWATRIPVSTSFGIEDCSTCPALTMSPP